MVYDEPVSGKHKEAAVERVGVPAAPDKIGEGELQQIHFQKIVAGTPGLEFSQPHKKTSFLRIFAFTKHIFCSIITSEHQKSTGVADYDSER